jgi:hypothetical protein
VLLSGVDNSVLFVDSVIVAALGGQRDVAKLLDFGLVQDLAADAADRLTRTGVVLGSDQEFAWELIVSQVFFACFGPKHVRNTALSPCHGLRRVGHIDDTSTEVSDGLASSTVLSA